MSAFSDILLRIQTISTDVNLGRVRFTIRQNPLQCKVLDAFIWGKTGRKSFNGK